MRHRVADAPLGALGRPLVESARVKRVEAADDPAATGWTSEAFHDAAAGQLDQLARALEGAGTPDEAALAGLLAPGFACGDLRPGPRAEAFRDPSVTVARAAGKAGTPHAGAAGLAGQLRALAEPFAGAGDVHAKLKVYRIRAAGPSVETVANFQMRGVGPGGALQTTAIWVARWRAGDPGAPPRLESLEAHDHEESVARGDGAGKGPALYADRTEAVLGRTASFHDQLQAGIDYWLERMDTAFEVVHYGPQGLAIGDVNGDGLDDLYVCQQGGLPNRLFVQQPGGTVLDTSSTAGVDLLDRTSSALFLDLDNDGDQDLIVATSPSVVVFENDGGGRFAERARLPAVNVMSMAAADYDLDGDLDFYTCEYLADPSKITELAAPVPFYDARNGGRNVLYRNDGAFRFSDATAGVGLDVGNNRWSYAASWEDYDDDGDPDLYVANDFGRHNLYRNDHGHFSDVAAAAGVEDIGSGMSVSFGDYNGDGRMDLYVGNMWSSAGGRITTQERFQPGASARIRGQLQRFAKGSSLFENRGDGTFRDVTEAAHVDLGRWAWGSIFSDVNNDGWEDLVVVNGFMTRPGKPDL